MTALPYAWRNADADSGATPLAYRALLPLTAMLAAMFVGVYALRASLVAYIGTSWMIETITQASIASLGTAFLYVLAHGVKRIQWRGALMILAAGASLVYCEAIQFAVIHWAGWAMMVLTIGPVNNSPAAQSFRCWAAKSVVAVFVAATVLSLLWQLAGMPNLGRGDFTGVMWHSMTLAPVAALAGLAALARAASGGSPAWYALFASASAVVMLASSRSALAALALGVVTVFVLKFKRHPIVGLVILTLTTAAVLQPDTSLALAGRVLPAHLTSGLANKSWNHSRELHWDARWEEFLYSPYTGVGFACGWEETAGYNEETGAIETGSSYLSILSMTGLVGAAAFLILVGSIARRVLRAWPRFTSRQRLEIGALAAFWTVHLGAEGYVYGVGSLIGLAFWLWLGRLFDQTNFVMSSGALPQIPSPLMRQQGGVRR